MNVSGGKFMGSFFNKIARKEDPAISNKDGHLKRTLRVHNSLALGVGTIVSTSIFTLPGIVAAEHAGPAVALSFLLAAIVAGLVNYLCRNGCRYAICRFSLFLGQCIIW